MTPTDAVAFLITLALLADVAHRNFPGFLNVLDDVREGCGESLVCHVGGVGLVICGAVAVLLTHAAFTMVFLGFCLLASDRRSCAVK